MAINSSELSKARRAGFRRKKPKKPRQSSSLATWERFEARMREWEADAKKAIASAAKKQALINRYN